MSILFIPGQIAEFDYPARNRFGVPLEFVRRRVRVVSVSDVSANPVETADVLSYPLVRRGRLLLIAHDLDLDSPRKFWVEAIRRGRKLPELPTYRLGIYDADNPDELTDWIGSFPPTVRDRLLMKEAAEECLLALGDESPLKIAAFPFME